MSDLEGRAPVVGTCAHCGCALNYASTKKDGEWFCCGACAGSDRCSCGCKPEYYAEKVGDVFVPTRRMFASRPADGLKAVGQSRALRRAFPFADKSRGR